MKRGAAVATGVVPEKTALLDEKKEAAVAKLPPKTGRVQEKETKKTSGKPAKPSAWPPVGAVAVVAAASAALGMPEGESAYSENIQVEVAAFLQASKNQAYATGLFKGVGGTAPFTAVHVSGLTALLLRKLKLGSEPVSHEDEEAVKTVVKASLDVVVNQPYAAGAAPAPLRHSTAATAVDCMVKKGGVKVQ